MDTNEEERAKVIYRNIVAPIPRHYLQKAASGCIMFNPQRALFKILPSGYILPLLQLTQPNHVKYFHLEFVKICFFIIIDNICSKLRLIQLSLLEMVVYLCALFNLL